MADGRGASGCRVRLETNDTRRRPVRRFLPRDFDLSAAPALAGDFSGGARLLAGGRPHTLDNPILPPCHATQALPARRQGRQGLGPSKALVLAPTSPGGDHFPRTRSVGSCVSPPNPAPAPPRHNALWCIRGRNAMSLGPVCAGGEDCVVSVLFLLGNRCRASPLRCVSRPDASRPGLAATHLSMRGGRVLACLLGPHLGVRAHNGCPHPEAGAQATLEGRGRMAVGANLRLDALRRNVSAHKAGPQAAVKEVFIDS